MISPEHGEGASRSPLARFEVQEQSGIRTIRAVGEIDVTNVAELRRVVSNLSNDALGIVLDAEQTQYIDSATVTLLYELRRRLARRGQMMLVVSPSASNVRRVLELTGFFSGNDRHPQSVAEATAAIVTQVKAD